MHSLDANDWFAPRHIGPTPDERDAMLKAIGARSLDALLDEATAAAEAMTLLHRVRTDRDRARFLVSDRCFPQTIDVVRGRAEPLDIEVEVISTGRMRLDETVKPFGILLQYPDECGCIED